jgi:hypothetical protein
MYEALLARGRTTWRVGDRVRVYRTRRGWTQVEPDDEDTRDYDVEHYVRSLKANYASRMIRAFEPGEFESVFADPDQPSLFMVDFDHIRPVLRSLPQG